MALHPITYARIDLGALADNYRHIAADSGRDLLCVVKADAYGHGAIPCATALYEAGARHFGVANPYEAISLQDGLQKEDARILILGYCDPEDAAELARRGILLTVYSESYARSLLAHLPKELCLQVHVKLDSGMNRLGFRADRESRDQTLSSLLSLAKEERLCMEGVFTHFACADEPDNPMTEEQYEAFSETLALLRQHGLTFPVTHACNSAGIYRIPEARGDLVRAGIILYGISPSEEMPIKGIRPVMSLHTRITHLHTAHPGERVGYGAAYSVPRPMQIATLAIGYADGLVRAYHGAGVRIGGKDCPIVGRICMDQCMADVTGLDVKVGDEAVFFDEARSVQLLSKSADMIPYETVCLIGKRVVRIYS